MARMGINRMMQRFRKNRTRSEKEKDKPAKAIVESSAESYSIEERPKKPRRPSAKKMKQRMNFLPAVRTTLRDEKRFYAEARFGPDHDQRVRLQHALRYEHSPCEQLTAVFWMARRTSMVIVYALVPFAVRKGSDDEGSSEEYFVTLPYEVARAECGCTRRTEIPLLARHELYPEPSSSAAAASGNESLGNQSRASASDGASSGSSACDFAGPGVPLVVTSWFRSKHEGHPWKQSRHPRFSVRRSGGRRDAVPRRVMWPDFKAEDDWRGVYVSLSKEFGESEADRLAKAGDDGSDSTDSDSF